jgi:PAS domain S-box-containing protein
MMDWQTNLYFLIIVITLILTGFLSWYAWKHAGLPGVKAYSILALVESLIAVTEIISMLSITPEQALFWFKFRFIFNAALPVIFVVFAVRYNGHGAWLSKRVIAILCLVPVITQFFVWFNPDNFWLMREVSFSKIGSFWISDVTARVPGPWFTIYSFYCLLLVMLGIATLLLTAWTKRRQFLSQALVLALGAFSGFATTVIPLFNLLPNVKLNVFVPGIGLSAILYAIAIFRFSFIKKSPADTVKPHEPQFIAPDKRSFAFFIAMFVIMVSGITALGYLSYRAYAREFQFRIEKELNVAANLKIDALSNWRNERYGDADSLAQNAEFTELAVKVVANPQDNSSMAYMQDWLDAIRSSYSYREVFLLDDTGNLIISSPSVIAPPSEHLLNEISGAFKTNQITWIDFHFHENNEIHISLLIPIKNKQIPVGVLVLDCDPYEWLYPFLLEWPAVSDSSETLLVRQEGNDVLFLNPIRFNSESALTLHSPLTNTSLLASKAVRGETGIVEGVDYRNHKVIGYVAQVPYSPWFLVAKMDKSEVFAPLVARLWQTIGFFGFLILATGASMGLLWRRNRLQDYRNRLQATEALRESEDKFAKAFITSPDGVSITSLKDGNIVMTNQAYELMLGYKREEVIGKSSLDLNIWVNPSERDSIVQQLQKTGIVKDFEIQFRTSKGDIRFGSMSATVIDINNETHILNITRDITTRKQMENDLIQNNIRLAALFEILQHDPSNIKEFLDFSLEKALLITESKIGYIYFYNEEKKEFTLNTWSKEVMNECTIQDAQLISQLNKTGIWGEAVRQRKPILLNDYQAIDPLKKGYPEGHAHLRKFLTVPVFNGLEIVAVVGVANKESDYSEKDILQLQLLMNAVWKVVNKQKAESLLSESEERYRALIKVAPVGILVHSEEKVLFANPEIVQLLGAKSEKQLIGKPIFEILHPSNLDITKDRTKRILAGEKGIYPIEDVYKRFDGSSFNVEVLAVPLNFKGEKAVQVVITDITERIRNSQLLKEYSEKLEEKVEKRTHELQNAQERLIRQERLAALGQLAGSIAHELRNPLGVISNATTYLSLIQPEADAKIKEYIGIIQSETQTSEKIIADLLDYTRLQVVERQPAAVSEIVFNALRRTPIPGEIKIIQNFNAQLPKCIVNPNQVEQVVCNLVMNAIQAMPNGGEIQLSAEVQLFPGDPESMLMLSVADDGSGISPENLEKIFEPLFTTKAKGIGLGLAVSRKLVEGNHGHISVESVIHKGTIFKVFLPIAKEQNES